MTRIESVCVFCGSKTGADPVWRAQAQRLGAILAGAGIRMVYGGGRIGLMGVVADAVLKGGGRVVGVIPDFLMKLEVGHAAVSELEVVDSMHARKRRMFELSDGFVILPGGLGTLDEAFEIITWKQLRQHAKPIVVMNTAGYWTPFSRLIDAIIEGGFAHPKIRDLFVIVDGADEVLPALRTAPEVDAAVLTSHL